MPRPSLINNIQKGIFTVSNIAKILHVSQVTVYSWLMDNLISGSYILPNQREHKIPATALVEFLNLNKIPIPSEVALAARNFKINCQINSTKKDEEILISEDGEILNTELEQVAELDTGYNSSLESDDSISNAESKINSTPQTT